jgi:hypothetical protein
VKKVLTWLATIFGAVALALLGIRAQAARQRADRNQAKAAELLRSNVKAEILKGQKLEAKADADRTVAHNAEVKMEGRLHEIAKNESLEAVADRFNSRRLRKRTDDTAT